MKMISQKRIRELSGRANTHPIVHRGRLCLAGPADWLDAVPDVGFPASDLDALATRSTAPWSIVMHPIEPKVFIRKKRGGWLVKWNFLGIDTVIHFSPDVTFAEIADPIRVAYANCVGKEVSA